MKGKVVGGKEPVRTHNNIFLNKWFEAHEPKRQKTSIIHLVELLLFNSPGNANAIPLVCKR
jgi:hypothetical protein